MNKEAYLKGYMSKIAKPLIDDPSDFSQIFEKYYNHPAVKFSKYLVPVGTAVGAGVGSGLGLKYSEGEIKDRLDNVILASVIGSLFGGLAGSIGKEKLRWPVIRKLMKNVSEIKIKKLKDIPEIGNLNIVEK